MLYAAATMGHQLSTALSRSACGPCIPGEFDFAPGYTRVSSVSDSQPSSPSRRSQPSRSSSVAGSEEALLSHRMSRTKSLGDRQQLLAAVRSSPLFKHVGEDQLKDLVDSMEYLEFDLGEFVVAEGSVSKYFYVAHTIGLEKVICGGVVSALVPGQIFGEVALLQKVPPSCSVVAARPKVGLWAGEGSRFREVVLHAIQKKDEEVRAFVGEIPLLQSLSVRQLDCIADMASVQTYEVGELPLRRGSEISQASFLKSGQLRRVGREETMSVGSCIGERLLFYGDTSGYPIEVTKRCELVHINARKLRQLVGKTAAAVKLQHRLVLSGLEKSKLLATWTPAQRASTALSMELSEFMPGARIPASIGLFVVLDGDVQVGTFPSVRTLKSGDVEGSPSEGINDTPSHAPAHHHAPLFAGHLGCRLAVLPAFCVGLRDDDGDGIRDRLALLSKISVFCSLQEAQLRSVARLAVSSAHQRDEVIVTQGDRGSSFFVLAAGELDVIRNGRKVRSMAHPACFGERALVSGELWDATVRVASQEALLWAWERTSLMQILEDSPAARLIVERAGLQDTGILLRDLRRCGELGCGTSGTVYLVHHGPTRARYALKKLSKSDGKMSTEVRREIEVLSENDHPFLLHMVKCLETPTNVYVLSEYVGGGELHAAMRTISTVFTGPQAMFYVGSLLLVIASLHERGVVYRDLKPENVMLDTEGYVKLIDFGTAKKLGEVCGRTFTMVGTDHYMAPEVMRGKGYGLEVDVWALGIILYELMCGHLPFGDNSESQREVLKAVLTCKPTLPQDLDAGAKQLIAALLEPRPRRRIGCGTTGLDEIKTCSFFKEDSENGKCNGTEVDYFAQLLSRKVKAPIKPGEVFAGASSVADGEEISDAEDVFPEGVEAQKVNGERQRNAADNPFA